MPATRPGPLRSLRSGAAGVWTRPKYRHVISLGYFCSTALELQRYGLRDGSYPLDWNISPIGPTLAMIETGFGDFLQFERLSRDPEHPGIVRDAGSGVLVYNDFDPGLSVAEQYDAVRERYERRIQRFRQAVAQRTLFVRYMVNLEEFTYLDENMAAVLTLLRRTHPQNDLLLVGNADLPTVCGGLQVYTVPIDEGDDVARTFLRKSPELSRRLLVLNYPVGLRLSNLLRHWLRFQRLRGRLRLRARLHDLRQYLRLRQWSAWFLGDSTR
jgi:hypothetical protein